MNQFTRLSLTFLLFLPLACTEEPSSSAPEQNQRQQVLLVQQNADAQSQQSMPQGQEGHLQQQTPQLQMGQRKGLPNNAHHLQKVAIVDPNGFGRPMTAATILVPVGWQTQGGVVWQVNNRGCGNNGTSMQWAAVAPDGVNAVELLPEQTWSGNNLGQGNGQCPNVWVTNIQEYLQAYVSEFRSTATIKNFRPRPDIAARFEKQYTQQSNYAGGQYRSWVEAGEVHLEYTYQGVAMEEIIQMMVVFMMNRIQGVYPGEIRQFLTTSSMPGLSLRAPRGKLNPRLAEVIRTSARPDPQYQVLMTQHQMKMAQINREGAMKRHQIRMQANREISDIIQRGYETRSQIQEQGRQKYNRMIREEDLFVNPDTQQQVELPFTHKNAWELDDGTYILTDDEFFQPFRDLGIDGRQLERRE